MIIFDPIYGRFPVPDHLARLVVTPEVRRLSQVRLLNTITPSLAALGDLRRYSHTLGVLFLCGNVKRGAYSEHELRALAASVLLHDIGTPPFGHLFEYHLKESSGWSHEGIIKSILRGTHAPENRAHQIFAGRTIEFRNALKDADISLDLVEQIVTGQHPLAQLLFGTIDLDNLDNVARMGWALRLTGGGECATRLSATLSVNRSSLLCLPSGERDTVVQWATLRRAIYEILVFDPPTVAAQAVLSEAIAQAISRGTLTEDDWHLTDEELLARLQSDRNTKDAVAKEYLGQLPEMICALQIKGDLQDLGFARRSDAKEFIERVLQEEFEDDKVLGYVFIDRGTFSKTLTFLDPTTSILWSEGDTSISTVFYGFIRSRRHPPSVRSKRATQRLIERVTGAQGRMLRCDTARLLEAFDAQGSLNFPTREN